MGAQTLSLEAAAERLGRGSKAGDRQNDVAARLRCVAKESTRAGLTRIHRTRRCFFVVEQSIYHFCLPYRDVEKIDRTCLFFFFFVGDIYIPNLGQVV